jgi:hypothetical protein
MKTCVTCKHFCDLGLLTCDRKKRYVEVPDLVTGGSRQVNKGGFYETPHEERASILPWRCGSKGRYHEPMVPA